MDRITQSLQTFLKSSKTQYQTVFNSGTENKKSPPTATSFLVKNPKDPNQAADITIYIFPKNSIFILTSQPIAFIDGKGIDKIKELKIKWNMNELFSRISVLGMDDEEDGCYRFSLTLYGVSDPDGSSKYVWMRYIEMLKSETFDAWKAIAALYNN
ncbi:MAG: hypothetical protein HDS99_00865 [Bacteroidales bacterium]|nr:hypothetical protein [Bacteroidales bacterium]